MTYLGFVEQLYRYTDCARHFMVSEIAKLLKYFIFGER